MKQNPLIIPLFIALILLGYFYGKAQPTPSTQPSPTPNLITLPGLSPIPTTTTQPLSQDARSKTSKIAVINVATQQVMQCLPDGVSAVKEANSQLQYEITRLDAALSDENKCLSGCKQNLATYEQECRDSSDYEKCLLRCVDDCESLAKHQMENIKPSVEGKTQTLNSVASKYCTK